MTYWPSPDDLLDEPMPDEWRRIADGVLPGNREQLAEVIKARYAAAFAEMADKLTEAMAQNAAAFEAFAGVTEAMRPVVAVLRAIQQPGTGHRHRGTRGWLTRNMPGRRDLPLGTRTVAKLAARPD